MHLQESTLALALAQVNYKKKIKKKCTKEHAKLRSMHSSIFHNVVFIGGIDWNIAQSFVMRTLIKKGGSRYQIF